MIEFDQNGDELWGAWDGQCQASDLVAVDGLRSNVLLRVQELSAPEERIERVRFADVSGVGQTLGTPEEVEELLEQLRDHLLKLIAAGVKVVLE